MKESITIYHEMSQVEEGQMLLFSDSHSPTLYGIHTPQVEVIRRRRRKKKEKGEEGRKKRRLSHEQVRMLESHFWSEHKLEAGRRDQLAVELGLDPHVVAVWFQNRRARWKAKQVEEEYESLKARYQTVLVDKCRLQAEVSKLKEQISEAEKEIKRLSERFHGVSSQGEISCSTISTLSKDDHHHEPFLMGDFDVEENGNFLYIPEYYYIDDLEWVNLGGF